MICVFSDRMEIRAERSSGMTRMRGSITIYLLLSMLLITALVFTLTESARIGCIQTRLKSLMFLSADSCFAEYSKEIFEDYGIMALWKSDAEFTADFNSYISHNLNIADTGLYRDVDLWLARPVVSALSRVQRLTDDQGNVFIEQVCDYMEYFLVREALEGLLDMLGIFDESEKIGQFVEKINSYKDVFLQVAESVSAIQYHVDKARSVVHNPKAILGNMNQSMQRYAETGNNTYIARFNANYWNLGPGRDDMLWHMDGILENAERYEVYAGQAQEAVESLRTELEKDRGVYSEETLQAISGQLDSLELKSGDPDGAYYRIEENAAAAAGYADDLASLDPLLSELNPQDMLEHMLDYQPLVSYYNASFEDFDLDALGLSNTSERVKREKTGFLSTVKDIFTKGLLEAVAGREVSERRMDMADLPSRITGAGASSGDGGSFTSAPHKRLILVEYIAGHFGSYMEQKEDSELLYEMEYILGGKGADKDNLKTAVRELVLLRSGLNMISMMRDQQKMQEAEALALAIVGFTGIDPLIESLKMLIMSVWCLAEALCDTKALLQGSKIPLVKEGWQWTVTITGLKTFQKSVMPAATDEQGMDYAGYLRILLLKKSNAVLAFRAMDVIQANACKNFAPDFRMKECINRVRMTAAFDAKALFSSFLFVRNIGGVSGGKYGFTLEQEYSYTGFS